MTADQNADAAHGVTLKQIAAMMDQSLYWSAEQLRSYQRMQLEQLVRHARAHCPFYRNRLDCLFTRDDAIDWNRWTDIPILNRADLRDNPDLLRSTVNPQSHGLLHEASTSGSTGVPITIIFPQLFTHVASIAWRRFTQLHGVDFKRGYNDFRMTLPIHAPKGSEHCAPRQGEFAFFILRTLPMERKLHWLMQSPFKILQDGPNHAELLARANLKAGKPLRLSTIVSVGMPVSEEQRHLFAASFGAEVITPYSSKEGSLLAFECANEPRHFHACAELSLLEVVDKNGAVVPVGEPGRCIITPFFNSAQPMIRYDQGDILTQGATCSGGITLPVIADILGRQDVVFKFDSGQSTMMGLDSAALRTMLKADAFQLAQTDRGSLEVRYVSEHEATPESTQAISQMILQLTGFHISINYRRLLDIPYNRGGKQQRFVNEYQR